MAKKVKLTNKDDDFSGSSKDERIIAKGGDDNISGGGGNDTIWGGDGNDLLRGGSGDDTIAGGAGNDNILGGTGDDTITAGAGDTVDGGEGDDVIKIAGDFATATVAKDGAYYVITTGADVVKVKNTELFQFSDGAVGTAQLDEKVTGSTGKTFTLTTAIDAGEAFSGTTGDDTFIGDNTTTSAADQIGGGEGDDMLRLFSTTTLPSMSGIETVEFNAVTTGTVDLSGSADVTNVAFRDADIAGADINVTVSGTQAVSLTSITDADDADVVNISSAASVTAQTVNLTAVGDVTPLTGKAVDIDIKGTGVATLTLDSSTTASNVTLLNTGAALKTLNVTGDAKLTLTGNVPNATTITSTNTAGLTASTAVATAAGLTITTDAGADSITLAQAAAAAALSSKVAVDLGAGDDTLSITNLTAANNIQAGATLKGGDGTDTLNIVNGAVLDATTGKQFSGFEVLGLDGSTGTFDLDFLAPGNTINKAVVGAALSGAVILNNLAVGGTVVFNASTGANTVTVNQKDAGAGSPDDVISSSIDGKTAITVANVDFNDIETVNVSSTSTGTNISHTASVLAADEATKITVNASTAGLIISDLDADSLVLFDASASAKAVSVTTGVEAFDATAGVAFIGGAADDVLVLTGATTAGAGVDFVVTGNGGADDITLAAAAGGRDDVVYKAQTDSTSTKYDELVNFTTTSDKINLSAFTFTGTADDAILTKAAGVTIDGVTGAVVVSDAVAGNFFSDGGIDRAVAVFDAGADVYVFVDVNKDGDFTAAGDLVIELTGGADGAGGAPVIGDFLF